jgi:hypothetical protein
MHSCNLCRVSICMFVGSHCLRFEAAFVVVVCSTNPCLLYVHGMLLVTVLA